MTISLFNELVACDKGQKTALFNSYEHEEVLALSGVPHLENYGLKRRRRLSA